MAEQIGECLLAALNEPEDTDANSSVVTSLRHWNDDVEKNLLSVAASPTFREEDPSFPSTLLHRATKKLHSSLLLAIDSSLSDTDGWTDEEAGNASIRTANVVSTLIESNQDNFQYYITIAEMLRAAALFMRWYQTLQSSLSSIESNPVARLKSEGMLLLCIKFIEMDFQNNDIPDIPRFASIYVFRATYGNDELTVIRRKAFVDSLDGCSCLIKGLLKGDQPICRVFSLVRNVHHLISAYPPSIAKMDMAVQLLTVNVSLENEGTYHLLEVLVATMSWAFRSEPAFPGDESDRRSELMLEILRALFALNAGISSTSQHCQNTMTQIGIILCDLLKLPNGDARVYECKLGAVTLLLNAPQEYVHYLVQNDGIKPLVDIMAYQLAVVVIERTSSGAEDAAALVPILLVLQNLAKANSEALKMVKDEVFPPHAEVAFQEKVKASMTNETHAPLKAKNMAPLDAPKGTHRWKLIRLMTWTESNVKRSGCELLWTLCNDDPTQFVLRTGFGNAVHFLGMKGCVALPAGIET